MFLTIAIIASATFILPFLSLINPDYLPDFLLPISSHIQAYLPESLKTSILATPLAENVSATDNIIKPTEDTATELLNQVISKVHPVEVYVKDMDTHVPREINIVEYIPSSVHQYILHHRYLIKAVQYVNHYLNSAADSLQQAKDSVFYNSYVYPNYQQCRFLIRKYLDEIRFYYDDFLDAYYYTLSPESQEKVLNGLLICAVLVFLLLLRPLLKAAFRLLISDVKQYHDSSKKQFRSVGDSRGAGSSNVAAADETDDYIVGRKVVDGIVAQATSRKNINNIQSRSSSGKKTVSGVSGNSESSDADNSSLYNSFNDKITNVSAVNNDIMNSFKHDIATAKEKKAPTYAETAAKARTTQFPEEKKSQAEEGLGVVSFEKFAEMVNKSHEAYKNSDSKDADKLPLLPHHDDHHGSDNGSVVSAFDSDNNFLSASSRDFDFHTEDTNDYEKHGDRDVTSFLQPVAVMDKVVQNAIAKELESVSAISEQAKVTKADAGKRGSVTMVESEKEQVDFQAGSSDSSSGRRTSVSNQKTLEVNSETPGKTSQRRVSVSNEQILEPVQSHHSEVSDDSSGKIAVTRQKKVEKLEVDSVQTSKSSSKRRVSVSNQTTVETSNEIKRIESLEDLPKIESLELTETLTKGKQENLITDDQNQNADPIAKTIENASPEQITVALNDKIFDNVQVEESKKASITETPKTAADGTRGPVKQSTIAIGPTSHGEGTETESKVQLIPADETNIKPKLAKSLSSSSNIISPSKLVYQSVINSTSGITQSNVYSSIILPQSPHNSSHALDKTRTKSASSLKENLDSIDHNHSPRSDISNDSIE